MKQQGFWSKVTNLFNRYKEENSKTTLNPQKQDVFGEQARKNNPNLQVFNNAQNNIADIIEKTMDSYNVKYD